MAIRSDNAETVLLVPDARGLYAPATVPARHVARPAANRERFDTLTPSETAQRHWQLGVAHLLVPGRL